MKETINQAIVLSYSLDNEEKMELTFQVKLNGNLINHIPSKYPNMFFIEQPKEGDKLSFFVHSIKINGEFSLERYGFVPYIYGVSLNHIVYDSKTQNKEAVMLIARNSINIANWIEGANSGNPEIVFTNDLKKQVNTVLDANPNVAEIMLYIFPEKMSQYTQQQNNQITTKSVSRGGVGMGKDTNRTYKEEDFKTEDKPYLFTCRFIKRAVEYATPYTKENNISFNSIPRV